MYKQSKSMLINLIIQFFGLLLFKTPIAKRIGWSLWFAGLALFIHTVIRERKEAQLKQDIQFGSQV